MERTGRGMFKDKDGIPNTLLITLLLCGIFSFVVSWAAVSLREQQQANTDLERKQRILSAAGRYDPEVDIDIAFSRFDVRLVDLETGKFVRLPGVDPLTYQPLRATSDEARSRELSPIEDIAVLRRRENVQKVFLLLDANGELELIVLPVRGYGLWGTMYGFLALEKDLNTIAGLEFYQHKETPGLGAEIENPRWKSLWPGKLVFGSQGGIDIAVAKGVVSADATLAEHRVDGLAGATMTSRGVTRLLQFWLGKLGFGLLLERLTNATGKQPQGGISR